MQKRLAKGAAGLSIPRWVWIGILVLVAGPGLAVARPKLINWGNSTPINDNLIHDHYHMQRMPFDGIVLHPGPLEQDVFSPDAISAAQVDELIAIMKQTHFTRFTDNFLAIRMFALGNLGDPLYWHSDAQWEVATANLAKMARLAKEGGFKGILLDNEHYSPYRLDAGFRDANVAQARGEQAMRAMKQYFPDIKIIVTHGYVANAMNTAQGYQPPAPNGSTGFLDGLLSASDERYQYIEGLGANQAYCDYTPARFQYWRELARGRACTDAYSAYRASREHARLESQGRVSFGHYQNGQVPAGTYLAAIHFGLAETDEYVWIYSDYPYGFWRDERGNHPAPISAPVADEIAALRGPDYAIELPAPEPVFAGVTESAPQADGGVRYTVTVTSFKGSIHHFQGVLSASGADTPLDFDLAEPGPVAKLLDIHAPPGRGFTLEGQVTNSFGRLYDVLVDVAAPGDSNLGDTRMVVGVLLSFVGLTLCPAAVFILLAAIRQKRWAGRLRFLALAAVAAWLGWRSVQGVWSFLTWNT